ncbi:kinesin-related protein 12-like [Anastrepha ludens]|uniref:kinesin-related protein 12-like n=1 Tax=Anastrepha ludens TaxID=28586 RepID=UPI0023B1642B|nr:kinesin-related protein 12-like [Anastrepha ludens]
MFLTRMVSGFICSKNSNKNASISNQQQQQHPSSHSHAQQSKSPKLIKKTDKCKRSLSKTDSKKSISELLKAQGKYFIERPSSSNTSNNNYNNGSNNTTKEAPSTSKSTLKPPTKVKSGSWKRSEKQISGYNSISVSGKKSKSLRKRSPSWLKYSNTPVKIADKVTYVSTADSTSVCRPGTLYSDVLFGAGSSCLVKIKTLTPRRNANTAQKKLTKALLKCTANENEDASGSEAEADREPFPSLNGAAATPTGTPPSTVATTATPTDGSPRKITSSSPAGLPIPGFEAIAPITTSAANINIPSFNELTPPIIAPLKSDDDADVVILSEANSICGNTENGFDDVSYGDYLEQHFKQINGTAPVVLGQKSLATSLDGAENGRNNDPGTMLRPEILPSGFPSIATKPFTIDIPQWNFLDADINTDAYPKFLCQFEDEHYLKAEKMALLGLKLALGNGNFNLQQGKSKF